MYTTQTSTRSRLSSFSPRNRRSAVWLQTGSAFSKDHQSSTTLRLPVVKGSRLPVLCRVYHRPLLPYHRSLSYHQRALSSHHRSVLPCAWSEVSFACMHTYVHAYMHTYIHACMHACIHTYMHTYIHVYIHTYLNTCIHTYMHACIHSCVHTYIHTCMHTRQYCRGLICRPYM